MKLNAEWKDDCQGKRDFDGQVLSISTRYWPRGGGFHVLDRSRPELGMQGNETRPEIRPSATSSLCIWFLDEDGSEDTLDLARAEFEGETFEEIAPQVEAWAQEQMNKAVAVLRAAFGGEREVKGGKGDG
jgi:hypothetical protein